MRRNGLESYQVACWNEIGGCRTRRGGRRSQERLGGWARVTPALGWSQEVQALPSRTSAEPPLILTLLLQADLGGTLVCSGRGLWRQRSGVGRGAPGPDCSTHLGDQWRSGCSTLPGVGLTSIYSGILYKQEVYLDVGWPMKWKV